MSVSRTNFFYALLLLALSQPCASSLAEAQNVDVPARTASFVDRPEDLPLPDKAPPIITPPTFALPVESTASAFSGLALAPQDHLAQPAIAPSPVTHDAAPPVAVPTAPSPSPGPGATAASPLLRNKNDEIGEDFWKGSPSSLAQSLINQVVLTRSALLNRSVRQVLIEASTPSEGDNLKSRALLSQRIQKLLVFGDSNAAWDLTQKSDTKLIDDATFHLVTSVMLASGDAPCQTLSQSTEERSQLDWQKERALCQVMNKDMKAAQVTIDVMRAEPLRDDIFVEVMSKNVLGDAKTLPSQLTPLTPHLLGALRLSGLPVPGELYNHPDYALVPALLQLPTKQDNARLGLAERAAARGVIGGAQLGEVYKSIAFKPTEVIQPLIANQSGLRFRALLYQAALTSTDAPHRVEYALAFVRSAPADVLAGASSVLIEMLGDVKSYDNAASLNPHDVAYIYALAGTAEAARSWLKQPFSAKEDVKDHDLWPASTLAFLTLPDEEKAIFASEAERWLNNFTPHDINALLLLDAAGFALPERAWTALMNAPRDDKHISLSPLLFERLHASSLAGRRGETILLSADLAGNAEIPLISALEITRALRQAGFNKMAIDFALSTLSAFKDTPG